MLYMFLLHQDDTMPIPPNVRKRRSEVAAKLKERNSYICSAGLEKASTATTVRVRREKLLVTDGPFAETKEALGGFFVIDCGDLTEALEFAKQLPDAQYGAVEIRAVTYPEEAWLNGERKG